MTNRLPTPPQEILERNREVLARTIEILQTQIVRSIPTNIEDFLNHYIRVFQVTDNLLSSTITDDTRKLKHQSQETQALTAQEFLNVLDAHGITSPLDSIKEDYIVCLECGFVGKYISKRHLAGHSLTLPTYLAKFKLPFDTKLFAKNYLEQRSRDATLRFATMWASRAYKRRIAALAAPDPEEEIALNEKNYRFSEPYRPEKHRPKRAKKQKFPV
jgi:predicted transcriptional regulator